MLERLFASRGTRVPGVALLPLMLLALDCAPASAQAVAIDFATPQSGDCIVRMTLAAPLPAALSTFRLLRDGTETDAVPRAVHSRPGHATFEFALHDPLLANSQVRVDYLGVDETPHRTDPLTVAQSGHLRSSCRSFDERQSFEPNIFYGVVADAFAPNATGDYPENTDYRLKASQSVAISAQLHLVPEGERVWNRIWLEAQAIYGVRAGDLDCTQDLDKKSPLCDPNSSAFQETGAIGTHFTANVLRASRLGAVFSPRAELFTLNKDTTPITFFAGVRIGFSQFPNDVKPANIYGIAGGFLAPSGPFRESTFTFVEGKDESYRTNPNGWRSRMDFRLVFNTLPSFKDQIPFLSGFGKSVRGLVEVIVDRNFRGPGPDATQTYLGLVFDVRQILGGK